MKKQMLLLAIAILSCSHLLGQAAWTNWQTVYSDGVNRVQISFKLADCGNVAGTYTLKGYSYYRISNQTACDKCHLTFKYRYEDCNGQIKSSLINFSMAKAGIEDDMGQWFLGPKVTQAFFDVEFKDYSYKPKEKSAPANDYSREDQQRDENQKKIAEQQKRNQQIIDQINFIKSRQQQQSQRIWDAHSSIAGLLGQMQQKNIRRYTQEMFDSRDKAFQEVQQELRDMGGTGLQACYSCDGNGIQQCIVCEGNPFSPCNYCQGSGRVQSFGSTVSCSLCYGQGKKACSPCFGVGSKLCSECYGKGYEVTFSDPLPVEDYTTTNVYTPPDNASGVNAFIQQIWIEHNIFHNQAKGMRIHVKFQVNNMKSLPGVANAYFYLENGTPLKDFNGLYRSVDNSVSAGTSFTPGYDATSYEDLTIFMPYNELHCNDKGRYNLKFYVELFYQPTIGTFKNISSSAWQFFYLDN